MQSRATVLHWHGYYDSSQETSEVPDKESAFQQTEALAAFVGYQSFPVSTLICLNYPVDGFHFEEGCQSSVYVSQVFPLAGSSSTISPSSATCHGIEHLYCLARLEKNFFASSLLVKQQTPT